jgi:hypothetical protein
LQRPAGEPLHALKESEEVPAAVVARKGVELVDDDGPDVR